MIARITTPSSALLLRFSQSENNNTNTTVSRCVAMTLSFGGSTVIYKGSGSSPGDGKYALLNGNNNFEGNQNVNGNVSVKHTLLRSFLESAVDKIFQITDTFGRDSIIMRLFRLDVKQIQLSQRLTSSRYIPGWDGTGFSVRVDDANRSHLEVDTLSVRERLEVAELVRKKISVVGGELMVSNGITAGVSEFVDDYRLFTNGTILSASSKARFPYLGTLGVNL